MNKFIIVCLALLLPFAACLTAEWKSLDNAREAQMQVKLLDQTANEIKVEVTVPGYHQKTFMVNEKECMMVHIPGSSMLMEKGFPMLPKLGKLVKLDSDCKVTMEVISKEVAEVEISAPIVPSRGHLTRDINPSDIPAEFGPIYKQDEFWPAEKDQFTMGKCFQLRDVRGIRVQMLPISVNHVQMKMRVIKKAVVSFKWESRTAADAPMTQPNKTFNKLYNDMFVNYNAPQADVRGNVPDENNRKMVVVTPSQFEGVIADWVTWKKKCGFQVTVHTVSSGVTAGEIKSYLQGLYDNTSTRFGYVVLIGDADYQYNFEQSQPMPTFKGKKEGAAADRVYVRLAGDDNYPDAFVSRISGNNNTEIKNQLDKIIKYEQAPAKGDWFVKGICIASNQGSPKDFERTEWLQNGGGKSQKVPVADGGLMGYGYTHFDDIYDPYAYSEDVANAVNQGRSIICYVGHGSATSWVSSGFNVSDVHNLNNTGLLPVIWSVACVNGKFVHVNECFGEAWLRKANGGAVAMECASTNESWVPPCDKQSATVNAMIRKTHFTFGALEAVGCVRALETWGDSNSSEGNKLAEQCNLFGDCTLMVRSQKPVAVDVTVSRGLQNNVIFQVSSQSRAPKHAVVTVYSEDLSFQVSSEVNGGTADLSLDGAPKMPLFYTVVGSDLESKIDQPLE